MGMRWTVEIVAIVVVLLVVTVLGKTASETLMGAKVLVMAVL